MRGDGSAYSTLGLEPGADQASIDRAYKALIKRYHPDRQGGDARRASEINQAYFELRKSGPQPLESAEPVSVAEAIYARRAAQLKRRRQRKRPRIWPVLLIGVGLIGYLRRDDLAIYGQEALAEVQRRIEPPINDGTDAAGTFTRSVSLDDPIAGEAVREAVGLATRLHRAGKEDALAEHSRSCHQALRADPSLARLDSCSAFDNAVLELQQRDPLRDEGPFGASAVTARQISAATVLSNDYLAIEARLDRVRSRVQLQLAPPQEPASPGTSGGAQIAP